MIVHIYTTSLKTTSIRVCVYQFYVHLCVVIVLRVCLLLCVLNQESDIAKLNNDAH